MKKGDLEKILRELESLRHLNGLDVARWKEQSGQQLKVTSMAVDRTAPTAPTATAPTATPPVAFKLKAPSVSCAGDVPIFTTQP